MTGTILMTMMGLVVLAFVIWYGFFVIALPTTAAISYLRERVVRHWGKEAKSSITRFTSLNPQLGPTMADGGDTINEEKKRQG